MTAVKELKDESWNVITSWGASIFPTSVNVSLQIRTLSERHREVFSLASKTCFHEKALLKRGYSREDVAKIMGENLLRIFDEVVRTAKHQ